MRDVTGVHFTRAVGALVFIPVMLGLLFFVGGGCSSGAPDKREAVHAEIQKTLTLLSSLSNENPDKAIGLARQELRRLAAHPDPLLEIRLYNFIGSSLSNKGVYPESEQIHQKALKLAERHNSDILRADSHISLGRLYWKKARYDQAFASLFSARAILKNIPGEFYLKGLLHNALGLTYWNVSNPSVALEHFIQSETFFSQTGSTLGLAIVSNNIGLIYIDLNNYNAAMDYFLKGETLLKNFPRHIGMTSIYLNIALIHEKKREWQKSLDMNHKALEQASRMDDLSNMALIMDNMSYSYIARKEYRLAAAILDKALKIRLKLDDRRGIADTYTAISSTFLQSGFFTEAEKNSRKALELAEANHYPRETVNALETLSATLTAQGKDTEALACYKKYHSLIISLLSETDRSRLNNISIQYEAEKKSREIVWLRQSELARELELERINAVRAVILIVIILALALILLLYTLYHFKIRRQRELEREIAAHKLTQKRLREKEKMFRTLAARAPLGVFILQGGVFKYINPQIAVLSGYPSAELLHHPPAALIHPDDRADALSLLNRDPGDASPLVFSIRSLQRNGEVRQLEIHAVSLYYEEKPALLGAVVDVTRALQIKKALWEQQEHESVARLAGGLAHDFNNLLAVIIGYLNMALDPAFLHHPAAVEKINRAERAAQQMAELIRSILRRCGYSPDSGNEDAQLTETGLPKTLADPDSASGSGD